MAKDENLNRKLVLLACAGLLVSAVYIGHRTINLPGSGDPISYVSSTWTSVGLDPGGYRNADFHLTEVRGIAIDKQDAIYFIDANAIYRLDSNLNVKLVAGDASAAGYRDGVPGPARFDRPSGIAVDANGTVYVADTYNHVIRQISPTGVVSTLYGQAGRPGSIVGSLNYPAGLAIDRAGNLLIADWGNQQVLRIAPGGKAEVVARALAIQDEVRHRVHRVAPTAVDVASDGNLLIADDDMVVGIRAGGSAALLTEKFSSDGYRAFGKGRVEWLPGKCMRREIIVNTVPEVIPPAGPPVTDNVAVDSKGRLIFAPSFGRVIYSVDVDGYAHPLVGMIGSTVGTSGIAVDVKGMVFGDAGSRYWGLSKWDTTGKRMPFHIRNQNPSFVDGSLAQAAFANPAGIVAGEDGAIYVADGDALRKIDTTGQVSTLRETGGFGQSGLPGSAQIAASSVVRARPSGGVYVASREGIMGVTETGEISLLDSGPDSEMQPFATDQNGKVAYCSGQELWRIRVFGIKTSTKLRSPGARCEGLEITPWGDIWQVHESYISTIASDGTSSVLAGNPNQRGQADGVGQTARFQHFGRLTFDHTGNAYILDLDTVRKMDLQGRVTTFAAPVGSVTGTAIKLPQSLGRLRGIAITSAGDMYLTAEGRIIKIRPTAVKNPS